MADEELGHAAKDDAVFQGPVAAPAHDFLSHPALAQAHRKHLVAVQDLLQSVRGQGLGMSLDGLPHRHIAHPWDRVFGIIHEETGLVERREQLGEAAMPIGERVQRGPYHSHLEYPRHDRHQIVTFLVPCARTEQDELFVGQSFQDGAHLLHRPVRGRSHRRRGLAGKGLEMADQRRLFLGIHMLDEGDQLITDRRAHEQRVGVHLGHFQIGRGDAGIVADLFGPHRPEPRFSRANDAVFYLYDPAGAGIACNHVTSPYFNLSSPPKSRYNVSPESTSLSPALSSSLTILTR